VREFATDALVIVVVVVVVLVGGRGVRMPWEGRAGMRQVRSQSHVPAVLLAAALQRSASTRRPAPPPQRT
jgi:hypothetical protein